MALPEAGDKRQMVVVAPGSVAPGPPPADLAVRHRDRIGARRGAAHHCVQAALDDPKVGAEVDEPEAFRGKCRAGWHYVGPFRLDTLHSR